MSGARERWMLAEEARAMLTRLARLRPLVLQETMVLAASPRPSALAAIEPFLMRARTELHRRATAYLKWIGHPSGAPATTAEEAQRRFTLLKLRFNAALTQFDIFSEAMSQRSESETGVLLAGLDVAATEALALPGYFAPPPVLCYLARDPGGAIRRARSRLPGGGENPVAVVRLPRERMIGSGIASSLVHEVGHQAADLLDLVPSLRQDLLAQPGDGENEQWLWAMWRRCLSEIVADLWAVARVGVASTLGLISLVSLPRAFVFRPPSDDPHPTPWVRVKLSCAMGDALYPHPQWRRLAQSWESFYPMARLAPALRAQFSRIEGSIPRFLERLLGHRPRSLRGRSLRQVMHQQDRTPGKLAQFRQQWRKHPALLQGAGPCLAFATMGQGRADGTVSPTEEAGQLTKLLRHWALSGTLAHLQSTTPGRGAARLSPFIQSDNRASARPAMALAH
jgi:hypothetical protein